MTAAPDKRPAYEPAAELLKPASYDPNMKRPVSTVAGVLLVFLRVVVGAGRAADASRWTGACSLAELDVTIEGVEATPEWRRRRCRGRDPPRRRAARSTLLLRSSSSPGHNWARVMVMMFSAISITASFIQWWAQGQEITISGSFCRWASTS